MNPTSLFPFGRSTGSKVADDPGDFLRTEQLFKSLRHKRPFGLSKLGDIGLVQILDPSVAIDPFDARFVLSEFQTRQYLAFVGSCLEDPVLFLDGSVRI